MLLRWRIHHYDKEFFGDLSPHTRLTTKTQTPYGAVELKLRVVWGVPRNRFSQLHPGLTEVSQTHNYCQRFTVVIPGKPPQALVRRTLDYFDGLGSTLLQKPDAIVLLCDRKWVLSARGVINRYGDNRERNLIALSDFMLRRMRNAYGPLFR